MSAAGALVRKEALEVWRTWRRWVLPGAMLLFAVASPLTALATPALLRSLTTEGVTITVPDPSWRDSYAQWAKNLVQLLLLLVVVTAAGAIADERRRGTLLMVVTKPISRPVVVLVKAVVLAGLVLVTAAAGTAVVWVGTRVAFGTAPVRPLLRSTAVWCVLALVVLAVTLLASAVLESGLAAAAVGVGASFVLMLAGLWGPAARWSPAGLPGLVSGEGALLWPVVTGVALAVVTLAAAAMAFARIEL